MVKDPRPITKTTDVDRFLDHTPPFSFVYRDSRDGMSSDPAKNHGRFLGTMAQSLQADPYGKQVVKETPGGLQLEIKPLVSAITAASGRLHQRSDQHEHMLSMHSGLIHALGKKVSDHEQMIAKLHNVIAQKLGSR